MDTGGASGCSSNSNVGSSSNAGDTDNSQTTEDWCETKLNVVNLSYKWTIDNFSLRPELTGEFLSTPTFSAAKLDQVKWSLVVYPKSTSAETKDYVCVFVTLVKSDTPKVSASFSISILDKEGKDMFKREVKPSHCFQNRAGKNDWGWTKFVPNESLLGIGNGMLHDDKLTLLCKLSIIRDTLTVSGNSGQRGTKRKALSKDFEDLLGSERLSDVVLLVGGRKFKAHKAVLTARSPVFSAMFESVMKEKMLSRVEIPDIAPDVFQELLEFVYTDTCKCTKELATDLLAGANKYALDGLKTMCEEVIGSGLNVENAADVLILADHYSASQLKAVALKFIAGRSKEVVNTAGWKSLMASDRGLLAEVCQALT